MSMFPEDVVEKNDYIVLPPQTNCPSYIWSLVDQEKMTEEEANRILNK